MANKCESCGVDFEPPRENRTRRTCSRRCSSALNARALRNNRFAATNDVERRAAMKLQRARLQIMKRGFRQAKSGRDGGVERLQAIVAASSVVVTKLPRGTHKGWQPSWME